MEIEFNISSFLIGIVFGIIIHAIDTSWRDK